MRGAPEAPSLAEMSRENAPPADNSREDKGGEHARLQGVRGDCLPGTEGTWPRDVGGWVESRACEQPGAIILASPMVTGTPEALPFNFGILGGRKALRGNLFPASSPQQTTPPFPPVTHLGHTLHPWPLTLSSPTRDSPGWEVWNSRPGSVAGLL